MKKKLAVSLFVMVMGITILAGCGGDGRTSSNGNESTDSSSDTESNRENLQENTYIENGITIEGKMYDFHVDGILDSELEEIIPIMAQKEASTVQQIIEYLSGMDKDRAFEKVEVSTKGK